jgi:adenine-specific DNA-methyltransferase
MARQNLLQDLEAVLQQDQAFISDGTILKNSVIEAALKMDPKLLALLLQSEPIKGWCREVGGNLKVA